MLTKAQFLVPAPPPPHRMQGRENVDNIVDDVTIFVFCFRHMTANVSSATAVTAVVKQPFRTIVRVAGKFLCRHSSPFLVQKWLKGNGDVDEGCSRLEYYAASRDVSLPTFRDNWLVTHSSSRIPRRISWPLSTGPIICPETSVSNYHYTLPNIPEERRTYLHRGGTLKSRNGCRRGLYTARSLYFACWLVSLFCW